MTKSSAFRLDAHHTLTRLLVGAMATHVVGVAISLDLADTIGDDEWDIDDLARAHGIPSQRMIRLLRTLTSLGLCNECGHGKFALTDAGSLLRRQSPGSLRDFAQLCTDPFILQPWSRLESSIRSGGAAFDEVFGMPVFKYLANKPELLTVFNAAMSQGTREVTAMLPGHYNFGRFSTVVDVGGGDGTLLTAILKHHSGLKGVLFDTIEGTAQAADIVNASGLSGRCTITTGDFFDTLPAGADLYLLKSVVHNWDDDHVVIILRRCREAMHARGRLLIIEPVLPDTVTLDAPAENPYLADLHMLVMLGGKERTRAEFQHLCTRAGLTVNHVVPLTSQTGFSLVEAAPTQSLCTHPSYTTLDVKRKHGLARKRRNGV
jgi:O-methyltransferase domain